MRLAVRRLKVFLGTFAPAARASDRPIAIACLRLLTFRPERPLLNVPRLRSRIARPTFADAFFEYLRAITILRLPGGNRCRGTWFQSCDNAAGLKLIRSPQAVADAGLCQHELRALGIGLDFLPELAHIDP